MFLLKKYRLLIHFFLKLIHNNNGDIMNVDIRKYIINNFKEDDNKNIRKAIEESMESHEDDPLVGLGVFFELLWNNTDELDKEKYIEIILNSIKTAH